jgi:hypothetical protein
MTFFEARLVRASLVCMVSDSVAFLADSPLKTGFFLFVVHSVFQLFAGVF